LRYIGVIARRIGAIVPGFVGVRPAVVVVAIIRIRASPWIIIIRPRQSGTGQPPAVASAVLAMVPVPPVATVKAVVQAREAAVEPAGVKSTAVETAAVKPAAVKPTKSAAVPSAPVRCVGEVWLAEDRCSEERSCNAHHTPPFARPGSAIA
jgi:hypothetical protein